MTDFAKQVIVDNFAALPEPMQHRILRMLGVQTIDLIDTVAEHRLIMAARHVTSFMLRPQRPVSPG